MADWHAEIRRRLAPLALPATREMEIVEEIAQHLDDRYSRSVAAGSSAQEAEAIAWRELDDSGVLRGAIAQIEPPEPLKLPPPGAASRGNWPRTLWQDIRYSARGLRGSPLFSVTVLLAVALSIGPVTAILSIGNWLFWRPHTGVSDPASLGLVWFGRWRGNGLSPAGVSYDNLDDLRARAHTFTGMAGVMDVMASLAVPGRPAVHTNAALVTANFFDVLGVRLRAGRTFTSDEDRGPLGAPVVVISHALALAAFGSTEAALGKEIVLNSRPFSIIGVADPAFRGVSNTGEVNTWLTGATLPYLQHQHAARRTSRGDGLFYQFVVRAAPQTTFTEVESELTVLARQLADTYPRENEQFLTVSPRLFPGLGLSPLTRAGMGRTINILLAVGAVLLLLGCANAANLLVFRVARRAHDIAVRKALGASPFRLLQLQMVESWLLAMAGAGLGLVLAVYLKQLIGDFLFPAATVTVPMDMRVLVLTVIVAVATGTLSALIPGWLVTRTRGLAAVGRTTFTWSRAPTLRGSLAVLQLALSVTLLVGALLLVSTLRNLRSIDLGFDPHHVTMVGFDLGGHGYDASRAMVYHREVLPALRASGEFEAVGLSFRAPFGPRRSVQIVGRDGEPRTPVSVGANGVGDNYFRLLSIPIVRGRAFAEDEAAGAGDGTPVIVSETLARHVFGTVDVVGRSVRLARVGDDPEKDLVIVGVARDSRWRSISSQPEPFLYQPFGHFRSGITSGLYLLKSNLPSRRVGEIANAIAGRTASAVPLSEPRSLIMNVDGELRDERLFAWMLSLLAALGFGLAALGLYGLIAQVTIERRREFGIRLALGASGRDIVLLVTRFALAVASTGIGIGLALSSFGTRLIARMLFGVSPLDPVVYFSAALTLGVVVAIACIGPAWRAVRVPAVEVLRAE